MTSEARTNIFRKCMKNITDFFETTVANSHITGIKLANFVRKNPKVSVCFTDTKLTLYKFHLKKKKKERRKLAEISS